MPSKNSLYSSSVYSYTVTGRPNLAKGYSCGCFEAGVTFSQCFSSRASERLAWPNDFSDQRTRVRAMSGCCLNRGLLTTSGGAESPMSEKSSRETPVRAAAGLRCPGSPVTTGT